MEPFDATDLAGVWAPLVLPLDARGGVHARRFSAQLAGLAREVDGVVAAPPQTALERLRGRARHAVLERLVDACSRLELPLVLGAGRGARAADLRRLAALEPGALLVEPEAASGAARIDEVLELARAAAPLGLLLDLRRAGAPAVRDLVELAERSAGAVIGLALPHADEECCLALQAFEDELAVWVPGTEHATGHRFGAAGALSLVACLSPTGAAGWRELLDDDLTLSLAFERRLQRFWDGSLLPLAQRHDWSADELAHALVSAGGWSEPGPHAAVPPDARDRLSAAARELVPELF